LCYVISSGEWENLVLLDLETGEEKILVEGEGFTLSMPAWVQGIHNYGWNHQSQSLFYCRFTEGVAALWSVDIESGSSHQIDTGPYTWIQQVSVSPVADEVAFIASGPAVPERVVRWDGERLHVIARSEPENVPPEYLSEPEHVTWSAPDGMSVHGLFYPPKTLATPAAVSRLPLCISMVDLHPPRLYAITLKPPILLHVAMLI
jgi:dipeptidyl aminopeptidase/acylaminoacyl peptidase